jgi:CHAD domain-containing protein
VKPDRVGLENVSDVTTLIVRVLTTRMREVVRLSGALQQRDPHSLHNFRIACKRMRYALERFASLEPSLHPTADRLALLQDALGEAHDRDVLLAILPAPMTITERRLRGEREACVERAAALWDEVVERARACTLIVFE